VLKGGLDTPAVAVGPFLDGTLPPRTPNSPGSSQWTTVPAFPNLGVTNTIVISSNPGDDRIYVGSQDGLVVAFENRSDVSQSDTFVDLRDRVALVREGGLLGFVFHPEFGDAGSPHRRSFFVYYSSHCPLDASRNAPDLSACDEGYPRDWVDGFFNTWLRLSRFEVYEGTVTADPGSEQVLLNFRLYGGVHRGGGLGIRSDGHLYLSIGDQSYADTAQGIVDNFNGSTLQIAVNVLRNGDGTWTCPAGTHQPRRTFDTSDEVSGRYYCIPDDNPWLDPAGGWLEEYCAIGFRNPFRLAIDPVTARVWVADVGESSREEVNVIECGNNYGWPFREGTIAGISPEPASYLGVLTDPVVEFQRNEAQSIIGGYVYRGSKFPELYGRYLVGDYVTHRIWAVALDETTMTATKTYLTNFAAGNLSTWGQDNDGEVFLGDIYGTGLIYALDRVGTPPPDAPRLLSETGAFSNLVVAAPSPYWVPYALNQPFWSDGASKFRFIALPSDGTRDTTAEQIDFSETGDWTFPRGTVLMKHFELPLDEADPSVTTRLETRFIVLGDDDQWYGLTYRWRASQLEADLLTTEETASYTIHRSDGGTRTQTWYFPSRLDCLRCHRQGSGGALGLKTHQLNGDFTYPSTGRTDNQILTWNDLAMFLPPASGIPTLMSAPAYTDVTSPLQDRARSWLDANCSYCHRPGEVNAGFDARFTTPFADQELLWTTVRDDLGNQGTVVIYPGDAILSAAWQRSAAVGAIAMPPLAKALPEQPAVDLLVEWIDRLPSAVPNSPPALADPGDQNSRLGDAVALSLIATDDDGDALYFDAMGLPNGLSLNHDTGAISGTIGSMGTQTVTASASDGPAVSVVSFEWRLAGDACGDGVPDTGEECDDGNLDSGDGCTSSCILEFCGDGLVNNGGIEACEPPGTALCTDACQARSALCGDGYQTPPEQCEDGNLLDGDGCTSGCVLELCGDGVVNNDGAEACEPPGTASCTDSCAIRTPLCGDGFVTPLEQCDDGNVLSGDGCTSGCVPELCGDGVVNNNGTEACEPPGTALCTDACQARSALCGDGYQTPPEQCEDGNAVNGDSCTSGCLLEYCGDGVVNDSGAEACEPPGSATCTSSCSVRVSLCGDGYQTPPEQCEDGNLLDGDGCSSGCVLEFCGDGVVNDSGAEACEPPGTAACTTACTIRTPLCGDGFLTAPEQCDDGNLIDGDGCSGACTVEVPPACGDNNADPGEECDDGNLSDGDGCGSGCVLEVCGDGVVNNSGAEACEPPGTALCTSTCAIRTPLCGDGLLTPPEQCEDGNQADGDGCTSSCTLEFCGDGVVNDDGAEDCEPPGTASCTDACTDRVPACGDGFLTAPEQCEDGNVVDGDGCTSECVVEHCGDGVVNNDGAEACEPPSTAECTDNCTFRGAVCGDDYFSPPEECEDGNVVNGDGCSSTCRLEYCGDRVVNNSGAEDCEPPGTALCADNCTLRIPLCGDGHQTPPEQCEDGNAASGDGCTSACVLELCGDGEVNGDGAEECEPPGTALCNEECLLRFPACGDGLVTPPEECDDGNVVDEDGCSAECVFETAPFCGDGMLDEGEGCDDGNLVTGDGCSELCRLEQETEPDGGVPMPPDGGMPTSDAGVPVPDRGAPSGPDPGTDARDPSTSATTGAGGCSATKHRAPIDPTAPLGLFLAFLAHRARRRVNPVL